MAIAGGRGRGRGVGGERCSAEGCSNKAQASGRCRTHTGTLGQCSQSGCEKQAQYKGLCVAHGGRRVCTTPGCNKTVTSKGLCGDHGGGRRRSSSKRPRTDAKQDGAEPTQSGGSMMSLLLNEWPQDVAATPSTWTGKVQDGMKFQMTEQVAPMTLHQHNAPTPYNSASTWTVGDAKFSSTECTAGSVDVATSIALPQEQRTSAAMSIQAWREDDQSIKLAPLMPAAVMPATSKQSRASMTSLLLEGWSPETDETKTEESSAERDSVETTDSEKAMEKGGRIRKRALCTHDGCTKIAQSQGRCVTHGGKRCTHPGCTKSAQYQSLCTTHGGARTCTYPGCSKTIRSAGKCFEHGGGKQCSHSGCTKQAQSNGLCSTHRKFESVLVI